MKKIALLFTIVCTSSLSGMENLRPDAYNLPKDVWGVIIPYLANYDSLEDIVYTINAANLIDTTFNKKVQKIYGEQKEFTKLVHILAKKFNKSTVAIATAFATSTSKHYLTLVNQLDSAFYWGSTSRVPSIIEQDVDVNYTKDDPNQPPILFLAIQLGGPSQQTLEIIKLLLKHGANIHDTHPKEGTIVKYTQHVRFGLYSFYGIEDRLALDTLMKLILKTFCESLNEDERKKINEEYGSKRNLLSEEQISRMLDCINENKNSTSEDLLS